MYICEECKELFNDTKTVLYEDSEIWLQSHIEVCPFCGSEDFEEVVQCLGCGKNYAESDLTEGLCTKCEKRIQDKVNEFFKQFTEAEIEYIFESGILDEV